MHKAAVAHRQPAYPKPLLEGEGAVSVYLSGLLQQPLKPSVELKTPPCPFLCQQLLQYADDLAGGFSCTQANVSETAPFF